MKYGVRSLKAVLLKSVEQNVYASISPARALMMLKDLEYHIKSTRKNEIKFIHYNKKDLRK